MGNSYWVMKVSQNAGVCSSDKIAHNIYDSECTDMFR